ncbi:hypothetical protein [Bacillus sp. BHET2]|uniref:hypothetical protein n=1 Tax=Bacillus sp. BHET2 TaxID=2583818 RepID=UPI0014875EF7|nr:hypothetical protein [Bacillus sp. BHET2]
MNQFALLLTLFLLAVTAEWIGKVFIKRHDKGNTQIFSFIVWGGHMATFIVLRFLER